MTGIKVGICIPSFDTWQADFAFDLAGLMYFTGRHTPEVELNLFNHRLSKLPTSRNRLVRDAVRWGADFVFFLDSDMRFPVDALVSLLNRRKPIVAANCVQRAFPSRAVAWRDGTFVYTEADDTGIAEVESIGTAIMLISCLVFDRIAPPAFMFEHRDTHPDDPLGEDQYFCRKVREAGIPVFIDHDLSKRCAHVGSLAYTMDMARACRDKTPVLLNGLNLNTLVGASATDKGNANAS